MPHKKEQDAVPFKIFVRCDTWDQPFTGYIVKAKGLWYYKCRKDGCKCNKSAKRMHELFEQLLSRYCFIDSLKEALLVEYYELNKDNLENQRILITQLKEIDEKIDSLEESRYVLKQIGEESFNKFYSRYSNEQETISTELEKCTKSISNPDEAIKKALTLSSNLAMVCRSSDASAKEKTPNSHLPARNRLRPPK